MTEPNWLTYFSDKLKEHGITNLEKTFHTEDLSEFNEQEETDPVHLEQSLSNETKKDGDEYSIHLFRAVHAKDKNKAEYGIELFLKRANGTHAKLYYVIKDEEVCGLYDDKKDLQELIKNEDHKIVLMYGYLTPTIVIDVLVESFSNAAL